MTEDRSLDIVGLGKLADAVPDTAWSSIVDTICTTFKDLLSPVTSITSGAGRLITEKFDHLLDAEKVFAFQALSSASEKAANSNRERKNKPKTSVILKAIEDSARQDDEGLRELWSNLLANELVDGSVHPEFVRILSRLTTPDAQRLIEIAHASEAKSKLSLDIKNLGLAAFSAVGEAALSSIGAKGVISRSNAYQDSFIDVHLSNLNLINKTGDVWKITVVGKAFLEAVSDPSIEAIEHPQNDSTSEVSSGNN